MEEFKTNTQIEEDEDADLSIEELRAKYLKKPLSFKPKQKVKKDKNQSLTVDTEDKKDCCSFKQKRTRIRFISDILLLSSVFIVGMLTLFSFAVPATEIGGQTFYGKTNNIFDFIWNSDNSIINQLKDLFNQLANLDLNVESMEMISGTQKAARLLIILIPSTIVMIKTFINSVLSLFYFCFKKSERLCILAVNNISQNFIVYICFTFFGSVSGGVGENAYYAGYYVGNGMSLGMIIGLILIISVIIYGYISEKSQSTQEDKKFSEQIRPFASGLGCIGIAIVLTQMKMYSVFMYVITSSLSSAISTFNNGFEIKTLIFPVLNLFLFFASVKTIQRTSKGFNSSFKYLLLYNTKSKLRGKAKKVVEQNASLSFIPIIILSLLSLAAIYVLNNPEYGYGWSVDIYNYVLHIFIVSSLGQTLLFIFPKKKIRQRDKIVEEQNTAVKQS